MDFVVNYLSFLLVNTVEINFKLQVKKYFLNILFIFYYKLFRSQTGYKMWQSQLRVYISLNKKANLKPELDIYYGLYLPSYIFFSIRYLLNIYNVVYIFSTYLKDFVIVVNIFECPYYFLRDFDIWIIFFKVHQLSNAIWLVGTYRTHTISFFIG